MSITAYDITCKTTPALYSFLLVILKKLEQQYGKHLHLQNCITTIQVLFVNHQPYSQSDLIKHFQSLKEIINEGERKAIIGVIKRSCQSPVSIDVGWENPFHRYFESFLAFELLNSPSHQTLQATQLISNQIIHLLKVELIKQPGLLKSFLHCLSSQTKEPEIVFKFSKPSLNLEEIISILQQNDPNCLGSILAIHYVFARFVFRQLKSVSTSQAIVLSEGSLLTYLKTNFPQYISDQNQLTDLSEKIRNDVLCQWVRPKKFFGSLKKTRGRGPFNEWISSNRLGLLLENQIPNKWPSLNIEQAWSPDALCQSPDISSPIVQKCKEDLLYIAGPSGMTTLFLGTAELLGGLSLELKESYVQALIAYITGGGLHAIHEIIVIAHHLFGYFESYKDNQYQSLFEHFNQDDCFKRTLDKVWDSFLIQCDTFFKENTVPEFLRHQFCWSDNNITYSKHLFFRRRKVHIELKRANREYFESVLAQTVLTQPTLFPSIQNISLLILKCLNIYQDQAVELIKTNSLIRKELYEKEYFGKLPCLHPATDSAQEIFSQLTEILSNSNANLIEVIHVHAVFIRQFFKFLPINADLNVVLRGYEEQLFPNSWKTPEGRGRIIHNPNPPLTKRSGNSRNKAFQALVGESKEMHRCGIDEFSPCPQSLFYQAIKKTDIPFVSGISGHTAQLLSCALICAFWDKQALSEEALKEYFLGIAAYLIAGGNHSFHETAIVFAQLGYCYQPGTYPALFPHTFIESQTFKDLLARYPEYLDEPNASSAFKLLITS